ncbi:MAG: 4Fe-4S binding protein [Candidatus Aenigmatarchaeota archaeon]
MSEKASMAGNIQEAGNAAKNQTGSWRTFRPIVTDRCTGCKMCEFYCPDSAIKVQEQAGKRKAVVDYAHCKGCLICMEICPAKAIEKGREE